MQKTVERPIQRYRSCGGRAAREFGRIRTEKVHLKRIETDAQLLQAHGLTEGHAAGRGDAAYPRLPVTHQEAALKPHPVSECTGEMGTAFYHAAHREIRSEGSDQVRL